MAVADVVESIASFRPSRPQLGPEAALAEIQTQKGVLYDASGVEICTALISQQGFRNLELPLDKYLSYNIFFLYFKYTDQEEKMALSIRNAKAEKLARELAAESGENITQAITRALEERLQRLRGRSAAIDMVEEIMKISRRCSKIPDQDKRSPDEILGYGSTGVSE